MPGALDAAFRKAAEEIVKDLGTSLDVELDYVRKVSGQYDVATGSYEKLNQTYADISAPIEFVNSQEEEGREERQARVYVAPDQIGNNQPTLDDEITLKFQGAARKAQIVSVQTFRGGQDYLYILLVRF
nr:phage tail protein [uncultured Mediterranean phage uvMED]